MGLGDTGLGVVGNNQRRDAAKVLKRVYVGPQPRLHLLIAHGLGPSVRTRAQRSYEYCRRPGLASEPVVDRNDCPRPIDEYLLAGFMLLPQNHVELGTPPLV